MSKRNGWLLQACLIGALGLTGPHAHAEYSNALDRVSIWLGGYNADADMDLEASDENGAHTGNLELTDGRKFIGRARLDLLLWDSQGLTFDYFGLGRSHTQTLNEAFQYGDLPYEIDTELRSRLDFSAGSIAWHWWFGRGKNTFGIGLGAVHYTVKLKLHGTIAVDDQSVTGSSQWKDSAVAPLLNLGWKHAFNDDFRVYLAGSGVKKNSGPLTGHIWTGRAGLEWFPTEHVGVGAEYATSRISLDRRKDEYAGNLELDVDGPSLFLRMRF